MHAVIDADQLVFLLPDGLYSLFWLHHKREHLRILVSVVRLEIRLADLPGAEKFRSQVSLASERMGRSLLQFWPASIPNTGES